MRGDNGGGGPGISILDQMVPTPPPRGFNNG